MRALLSVTAFAIGCSTSPGEPTVPTGADGAPTSRDFVYGCPLPEPPPTSPPATFTGLYDAVLSEAGAAKCQASGCHGGTKGNGELSLGHTKLDAFCGMVDFGLIAPEDCTACPFCAAGADDGGACGESPSGHACCRPCATGGDAGVAAVPASVSPLYNVVTPDGRGVISMPRLFCGNRAPVKDETDAIAAWGRKGAPFD